MKQPNPRVKDLKELDADNFEMLQEQAALQSAIAESNAAKSGKAASVAKPHAKKELSHKEVLSEEEALQKAIYESTHDAAVSRPAPAKPSPAAAAAAAAPPKPAQNWLRMSSLEDVSVVVEPTKQLFSSLTISPPGCSL